MPSLAVTIDVVNQRLVKAFGINIDQALPPLTQKNTYDVSARFVNPTNGTNPPFTDADYSTYGMKLGVGLLNQKPLSGTFKLASAAASTTFTAALPFNITAAALATALNGLAAIITDGGVTVTGNTAGGPYQVVWNVAGTRGLLIPDASGLFPVSGVLIDEVTAGSISVREVQSLALEQIPAAFQDTFTNFPAAAGVVTDLVVGVTDTTSAVQRISLDPLPYGGTFGITCLTKQTVQIPFGADASDVQTALENLSSVGVGQVTVTDSGNSQWDVAFTGTLAEQPIAAMTVNVAGLQVPFGKLGTLDFDVDGIDTLVELGLDNVYFQIDVTPSGGKPFTVLQTVGELRASLLGGPDSVPTPRPSYPTTADMNTAIAAAITDLALGTASTLDFDTDATLAADSDLRLATQKAVKAFVLAHAAVSWLVEVADYTASSGDKIQADTSGGAFTITLPPAPAIGDEVDIEDATGGFGTNNLTIARNALKINGVTSDFTASVIGSKLRAVYISAGYGWSIK